MQLADLYRPSVHTRCTATALYLCVLNQTRRHRLSICIQGDFHNMQKRTTSIHKLNTQFIYSVALQRETLNLCTTVLRFNCWNVVFLMFFCLNHQCSFTLKSLLTLKQ